MKCDKPLAGSKACAPQRWACWVQGRRPQWYQMWRREGPKVAVDRGHFLHQKLREVPEGVTQQGPWGRSWAALHGTRQRQDRNMTLHG